MRGPAELLTGVTSLWLEEIGEPDTNDLRVVAVEAKRSTSPEMTELGEAFRVAPDQTSRVFELIWRGYVAYCVRNESYFRPEDGEMIGPDRLQVRSNTAFLAYVAATTFAADDFPGPLTHWALYMDWHCIDVVSVEPPEVRLLGSTKAV